MDDKDIEAMLTFLKPLCGKLYVAQLKFGRAASSEKIRTIAVGLGFDNIESVQANNSCFIELENKNEPLLAAGSFYLISEILSNSAANQNLSSTFFI